MKNVQPITFSIVSPSFNQGAYIRETLQSIVDQCYPELQHIIADGGSTDSTLDTLREFQDHYALEWVSEPDSGLYDALNKALRKVRGEWVGWINCDDLYPIDVVACAAEAIHRNPAVDVVCGDAEVFFVDRSGAKATLYVDHHYTGGHLTANPENLRITHLNACFFRKSFLDRVGQFDSSFRVLGDREYMFRIMNLAPASCHLNRVTCRYRAHPDSLTMNRVSPVKKTPVLDHQDPIWTEIETLCRRYIGREDMPIGIRRWCRTRLATRTAQTAALALKGGQVARFVSTVRSGVVLHPAWLFWLMRALTRMLRDGIRDQRKHESAQGDIPG